VDVKKNPGAHVAHAVPLAATVKPVLHVHPPLDPQTPLRQLQLEGGFTTAKAMHLPVPEMPSSQDEHPVGHGSQVEPKNPAAHVSHDVPVKPGAQLQVPDGEQTPDLEQGGEHVADSISRREKEPELPEGSCVISGTESQRINRSLEPVLTAIQTLDEIARDPAESDWEAFVGGVDGTDAN